MNQSQEKYLVLLSQWMLKHQKHVFFLDSYTSLVSHECQVLERERAQAHRRRHDGIEKTARTDKPSSDSTSSAIIATCINLTGHWGWQ
jgi:hypothetical protein